MKTVAVDFDGVIHSYTSGWKGATIIPDLPVPGAIEFLNKVMESEMELVIHTTRVSVHEHGSKGSYEAVIAIRHWLKKHGLLYPSVRITAHKPKAVVYIDDRAWPFEGTFPSLDAVRDFKPWRVVRKGGR